MQRHDLIDGPVAYLHFDAPSGFVFARFGPDHTVRAYAGVDDRTWSRLQAAPHPVWILSKLSEVTDGAVFFGIDSLIDALLDAGHTTVRRGRVWHGRLRDLKRETKRAAALFDVDEGCAPDAGHAWIVAWAPPEARVWHMRLNSGAIVPPQPLTAFVS